SRRRSVVPRSVGQCAPYGARSPGTPGAAVRSARPRAVARAVDEPVAALPGHAGSPEHAGGAPGALLGCDQLPRPGTVEREFRPLAERLRALDGPLRFS